MNEGQWRLASCNHAVRRGEAYYWERAAVANPCCLSSALRPDGEAASRDVHAHNGHLLVSAAFLISLLFFNSRYTLSSDSFFFPGGFVHVDYRPLRLAGRCLELAAS